MTTGGGAGQRSARSGFGSSIAEAGIIVTARERTGAAFGKVSENVGGMGRSFLGLGGILLRLLGPTLALTAGVGALVAIIGSAGVVLTSRPWLEMEKAQRAAEITMKMMNITAADQEAIFSKLERTMGRSEAMILMEDVKGMQAFANLETDPASQDVLAQGMFQAEQFDRMGIVGYAAYASAFTKAMTGDDASFLIIASEVLGEQAVDAVTGKLKPLNELMELMQRRSDIMANTPLTFLERLQAEIEEVGQHFIGIFGPIGNLAAGVLLPVIIVLNGILSSLEFITDSATLALKVIKDLFSFDPVEGIFSADTEQMAKDLWEDLKNGARIFFGKGEGTLQGMVADSIIGILEGWATFHINLFRMLEELVDDVVGIFVEMHKQMWEDYFLPIATMFNKLFPHVKDAVTDSILNPIKDLFTAWLPDIGAIINQISGFFGNLWGAIESGFNTIVTPILGPLEATLQFIMDSIEWILDKIPGIPGFDGFDIWTPDIPMPTIGGGAGDREVHVFGEVELNAEGQPLNKWLFNTLDDEMLAVGGHPYND
tara:strand:+ start:2145 stop:3773 length:1629 start_codon:yes stop_codon:yes gene_type:complete